MDKLLFEYREKVNLDFKLRWLNVNELKFKLGNFRDKVVFSDFIGLRCLLKVGEYNGRFVIIESNIFVVRFLFDNKSVVIILDSFNIILVEEFIGDFEKYYMVDLFELMKYVFDVIERRELVIYFKISNIILDIL